MGEGWLETAVLSAHCADPSSGSLFLHRTTCVLFKLLFSYNTKLFQST